MKAELISILKRTAGVVIFSAVIALVLMAVGETAEIPLSNSFFVIYMYFSFVVVAFSASLNILHFQSSAFIGSTIFFGVNIFSILALNIMLRLDADFSMTNLDWSFVLGGYALFSGVCGVGMLTARVYLRLTKNWGSGAQGDR